MKSDEICYNNHRIAEVFDIGRRASCKSLYGRFMMTVNKMNPVHPYRGGGELGKALLKKVPIAAGALLFAAALVFTGCSNGSDSGGETPPPVTKYKVELDHTIGGNVKVTPVLSENGMVAENTTLTFTATPLQGHDLEKWELNGTAVNGTELTYTLKVTANAQVMVFFKRNGGTPPTMHTVTLTEPEHGIVDTVPIIPGHHKVPDGSEITFKAFPNAGYAVDKWTVSPGSFLLGGTDGSTSATLKITEDVTVTVTFKQVQFKIDFGVDGGNGTLTAKVDGSEISSGDTVEQGKTVTFTATPDSNCAVEKWTNNGTVIAAAGTNATYNHTVSANANIKVKFKYSGAALAVNQQNFTGTVGDTLPVYKLVTAGSGDYTATPETAGIITLNTANLNSHGNITVTCSNAGSTRIKVKDNMSGQEAYSGTVTVQALVTIPDDFTAGGIHYRVVDKTNKYVHIDYKEEGAFGATVHIPATVTFNGETYAITGCTKSCLQSRFKETVAFTVDSANAFLCAEGGVLFNKDKTRLIKYPKMKTGTDYTVPDSVKTIGPYAFYKVDLTTLNLPEGKALTTVEDEGISNCAQLANVNIPSTLRNLGTGFLFESKITSAVIPEGVEYLRHSSLGWCPNLTRVEFPASFKGTISSILYRCPALTEVTCKALTPPSVQGFDSGTPVASCTLKVPAASVSAYENAPIWKNFKKPFVGF